TLLEATVFWSGEVSTNELIDCFGISRVQASKDFTLYQSLCPGNICYDKYIKRYVISEKFKPAFMRGTAGEFLQILKIRQDLTGGGVITLIKKLPILDVIEPTFKEINPTVLQAVNQAIVTKKEVRIHYQSTFHQDPTELLICPHALVFDGLRWHSRAFSHSHQTFRDFILARISSAQLAYSAEVDISKDILWRKYVLLRIGPHPGLSDAQKQVVEFDYGMTIGILEYKVRAALVPYFLTALRISDDDMSRNAMIQQIVLLNRAELSQYLTPYI
ncbi:MAG: WYL domain-containing protein, partial [Methylococcales bacterium]